MKNQSLEKFIIRIMVEHYGYNLKEISSKDGLNKFWGIEKKEGKCLVFLDKDNINNVNIKEYNDLIKIVILKKEDSNLKIMDEDLNKIIILDEEKNSIVYCKENLHDIEMEIYSILQYNKNLKMSKEKEGKSITKSITMLFIAANVIMYVLTAFFSKNIFNSDINVLIFLGAKVNSLISSGEYYRLFTAMFLHGGLMHLVLNMYALFALGPLLENVYGKGKYIIIYLASGIVSSIFSYKFSDAVSIGASGAIFGLLGATLIFAFRRRDEVGKNLLRNILSVIAINIFIGLNMSNIDNFAHLGGLIGGIIIAAIIKNKN